MARVYERLGSQILLRELEDIGLENTPQYYLFEEKTQKEESYSQWAEELEPMLEVGDHYIVADMLLSREDQMARGHVVAQSCDANGNIMGRAHTNPILDTILYQVEFSGGKVTEITMNIIAKSMYTQCDADENEYLLLDSLIDTCKTNKAIYLTDQWISKWDRPVTSKCTAAWKFMPVEGWFYLMGEVVQVERISSSADSWLIMSQLLTGGLSTCLRKVTK